MTCPLCNRSLSQPCKPSPQSRPNARCKSRLSWSARKRSKHLRVPFAWRDLAITRKPLHLLDFTALSLQTCSMRSPSLQAVHSALIGARQAQHLPILPRDNRESDQALLTCRALGVLCAHFRASRCHLVVRLRSRLSMVVRAGWFELLQSLTFVRLIVQSAKPGFESLLLFRRFHARKSNEEMLPCPRAVIDGVCLLVAATCS